MTYGHGRKVEAATLVLACGIAIAPAPPVKAGNLGPSSSGSVSISVSVSPRLLLQKPEAQSVGPDAWDQSLCMLAPSATGLFRLIIAQQTGSPVEVSWQDGPHRLPRSLSSAESELFQGRRSWGECSPALLGSSRLIVTPKSTPVSDGQVNTGASEVLMLVAPE